MNSSAYRDQTLNRSAQSWSIFPARKLMSLHAAWQWLNDQNGNSPLLESDFVIPLIDCFGRGDEILAVHGDLKKPGAMGVFEYRGRGRWDSFQPSQAPLGLWLGSDMICLESILPGLYGALPGCVLSVGIAHQDPDILVRPENGSSMRTLNYVRTCRVAVNGSFGDYWSKCSKNLRRNLRRRLNKLERLGIVPKLDVITDPADIAGAIREYGRLECSGWKGTSGTAVHEENSQGWFYRSVLERFSAKGAATVYRYNFNDSVVAMDLCIRGGDTLVNLKSAYDERFASFSPAFLLLREYLRSLFEDPTLRCLEFYGPEMPWYRQWGATARMMYHVNHYRWPWLQSIVCNPAMNALRRLALETARRRKRTPTHDQLPSAWRSRIAGERT